MLAHVATITYIHECVHVHTICLPVQLHFRDSGISITSAFTSVESICHKLLDTSKIRVISEGVDKSTTGCKGQAGTCTLRVVLHGSSSGDAAGGGGRG